MALTVWALWSVGEARLDAYVSLFTVEYLAVKSALRPRRLLGDPVAVALVAVFSAIVAARVLEVLGVW